MYKSDEDTLFGVILGFVGTSILALVLVFGVIIPNAKSEGYVNGFCAGMSGTVLNSYSCNVEDHVEDIDKNGINANR